jgi:acyl carrier protein
MNNKTFEEIKTFVIEQALIADSGLSRDTRIEKDLGITGDDAVELLIAYSKQFNVDVSKFNAAEYFEPEGMNVLFSNSVTNKKTLTLGDLEKGMIAGKLNEEIINS